jgi:hypothetical protein
MMPGVLNRRHLIRTNDSQNKKEKNSMNLKAGFLPITDTKKIMWLNNFSSKINVHAGMLGITQAEVESIHNDRAYFDYVVNMHHATKKSVKNITGYKTLLKHSSETQKLGTFPVMPDMGPIPVLVKEGMFDRISKLAQRIKLSEGYSEAIGQDLGIIAPEKNKESIALQPRLIIRLDNGRPRIKCIKGIAHALDLYADRKDGNGFVFLTRLLKMDYRDIADLPADKVLHEWEYKAMYVIGNNQVGLMSSVTSVIVKR